jgi:hypothetical protein
MWLARVSRWRPPGYQSVEYKIPLNEFEEPRKSLPPRRLACRIWWRLSSVRVTRHAGGTVFRLTWTGVQKILSAVFKLTIFISLITFIQRQEPLIETDMNHTTKMLVLSNWSFVPVSMRIYTVSFELNWIADNNNRASHLQRDKPINNLSTRGFVADNVWIWPLGRKAFDLTKFPLLSFTKIDWNDIKDPGTIYCLAIENRSVLSNQVTVDTILTSNEMFSPSLFARPRSKYEAMGGGYESIKHYWEVEATIKNDCKTVYSDVGM